MKRAVVSIGAVLVLVLALIGPVPAQAATHNLVFGSAYATVAGGDASNAQQLTGAGSFHYLKVGSGKMEMYIDPASQLGGSITIGQIQSISYHTVNGAANPSDVDFYLTIYTMPYVGGEASWYGNRLTGEPLYSNGYVAPSAWVWNAWTTDAGVNQLRFNDATLTGNQGFYGEPTLQDIQAGDITWSDWYTGGGASSTPVDYASQGVLYLTLSTGSGWSSFEGYLDSITISLTTGETYVIDLEPKTDPVYVDDDFAGSVAGTEVAPGEFFGYNAFDTVQGGIDNVSGSTVYVASGLYSITGSILCNIPVTISGPQAGIDPRPSAGSLRVPGDSGEAIIDGGFGLGTLVTVAADDVTLDGLEMRDGTGDLVASSASAPVKYRTRVLNCIVHDSNGDEGMQLRNVTDGVVQQNLVYNTAGDGINMCCGTTTSQILDNEVHDIDSENGAIYVYEASDMTVARNLVYNTTQNDGIKLGDKSGGDAAVSGGEILDNVTHDTEQDGISVYTSDVTVCGNEVYNSHSENGALYVAFNVDNVQITKNRIHDNGTGADARTTYGIRVGRDGYHPTNVVIHANDIAGNEQGLFNNNATGPALDATNNWWNAADGPSGDGPGTGDAVVGGNVDYSSWRTAPTGATTCAASTVDNPVTPVAEGTCLTAATPCNTVSFDIARTDSDNLRAFTITFQLSPELVLCNGNPGVDIVQGDYLPDAVSSLGNTNGTIYQVVDNGGGSYTVDSGILGDPCGATDPSGTLFTVNVAGAVSGEVTGTVTVTSVNFRDCGNPFSTIPGSAGAPASLSIDTTAPAPVTGVSATQQLTGNDTDGTTKIHLSWTPSVSGDADSVHVYRAGFGHYPEYDDAGGSVPGAPSYPPSGPWEHVVDLAAGGGSYVDEVASPRDFWYYAAFVTDGCGNVSAVSNMTGGTLNYHLGDFAGSGDNSVDLLDVSILGGAYGTSDGDLDYDNTVDIGPTTDNSTHGRPTTDNAIQFEDLIIFAINYGQVSKPVVGAKGPDANAVMLTVPEQVPSSGTFEVAIDAGSDGSIQGVSVPLTWNAQAVEPVGFRQGDFAASQDGRAMVLSPKPGTVDAAVFGSTFRGTGELATVIFRVIGPGAPGIGLGEVAARDHDNHPVKLDLNGRGTPVVPGMTRLLPAAQNPFVGSAMVRYAMAEPGRVKIDVYGLDGRLVRTLVNGDVAAGEQAVSWDGRDAAGRSVASGAYLIRFRTARTDQTQRVVRLR